MIKKHSETGYNLEECDYPFVREWHPVKNFELAPRDLTPGSHRKVWWQCAYGHEWEATVGSRKRGSKCPYCSGKIATSESCLEFFNPALAAEWHPARNNCLTPRDVKASSNRKVWWICSQDHEWQATVNNRNRGSGCPYCSGKIASETNCLQFIFPALAAEWHPAKNGKLTPSLVTPSSGRKVWWICAEEHEWQATIANRNIGSGCPFCLREETGRESTGATRGSPILSEWDYEKNGSLLPEHLSENSKRRVWWRCAGGHEWQATIGNRIRGNLCPLCQAQRLKIELRVYSELKYLFKNVSYEEKVYGIQCDIFLPFLKVAIDFEGTLRSAREMSYSENKFDFLKNKGIIPILINENPMCLGAEYEVTSAGDLATFDLIRKVIDIMIEGRTITSFTRERVEAYLANGELRNNEEYEQLLEHFPIPLPNTNLWEINQQLSGEWHPVKNKKLTPRNVSPYSKKKVWWLGPCGHEWQAMILGRIRGKGCPLCSTISVTRSLAAEDPALSREWHDGRNSPLTPKDVSPNSGRKVWWICDKGHEWQATIDNRSNGSGCPYCSKKLPSIENCLQTVNPALASEWQSEKNAPLTALDVVPNSHKKVWWRCSEGHEWKASVVNRNSGNGCPYCSGRIATEECCLQRINPGLARQWHPSRNAPITPKDVRPSSHKKVWWICMEKHEWEASVDSRNRGSRCPHCRRMKVR